MKLSREPAIIATVTAGLTTAIGVGAALNAVDLPGGWDWLETWLPILVFVAYVLTGLVIRPLVTPTAKLRDAGIVVPAEPADPDGHVRRVERAGVDPGPGVHRRVRRPGDDRPTM